MTPRQRRIIGVLVIVNVAFLVTLLAFLTPFPAGTSSLGLPSPVPTYPAKAFFPPACRRRVSEMLSQVGLGGTATLADQTVRFTLVYRVSQGEHAENLAQQVWKAFDVALALVDGECDAFSRIEVVIEAQGLSRPTQVYAAVDRADLEAFHGGGLSERAFIDRVQYRTELIGDDGL
jgi:hypothetical protein